MTNRNFKVGLSREQGSFLPPRIEDYVAPDNPVRAIEAYVSALDLAALGFRYAEGDGGARYRGLWRRSGGQRRGRGDEDATKGATGPGHCREDYGAAGETCEGQSRSGEAGG